MTQNVSYNLNIRQQLPLVDNQQVNMQNLAHRYRQLHINVHQQR